MAHGIILVLAHRCIHVVEHGPNACFAGAGAAKGNRSIGIGKAELFIFAVEIALAAGEGDNIL